MLFVGAVRGREVTQREYEVKLGDEIIMTIDRRFLLRLCSFHAARFFKLVIVQSSLLYTGFSIVAPSRLAEEVIWRRGLSRASFALSLGR